MQAQWYGCRSPYGRAELSFLLTRGRLANAGMRTKAQRLYRAEGRQRKRNGTSHEEEAADGTSDLKEGGL